MFVEIALSIKSSFMIQSCIFDTMLYASVPQPQYLGYILSLDGIKPQTKKVQAILALPLPQNGKQLRRFLGMIRYYRDIWERCSDILAPLTNLAGECGHTKVTN